MNLTPVVVNLHLGLEKPLRILHLTDAHIALADDEDSDALKEKSAARRTVFFNEGKAPLRDPVGFLEEAMEYAKSFDYTVITGDVFDRISHGSVDKIRSVLADKEYLFCLGNHEFSIVTGHAPKEQRGDILELLKTVFRGNLFFESKVVGGVNLIATDNSGYYWTEEQYELLKAEVAKGYPILLFTHSPLENGIRTLDPNHDGRTATIRRLILEDGGTEQTLATTCKVTDYIANEPLIKATFGGHFHGNMIKEFGNKNTYILGGLFKGIVGEIHID